MADMQPIQKIFSGSILETDCKDNYDYVFVQCGNNTISVKKRYIQAPIPECVECEIRNRDTELGKHIKSLIWDELVEKYVLVGYARMCKTKCKEGLLRFNEFSEYRINSLETVKIDKYEIESPFKIVVERYTMGSTIQIKYKQINKIQVFIEGERVLPTETNRDGEIYQIRCNFDKFMVRSRNISYVCNIL